VAHASRYLEPSPAASPLRIVKPSCVSPGVRACREPFAFSSPPSVADHRWPYVSSFSAHRHPAVALLACAGAPRAAAYAESLGRCRTPHIEESRVRPGTSPATARPPQLSLQRRLGLTLTAVLHALLAGCSGVALRGLPRLDGLPVLLARKTSPETRQHLQAALSILARVSPSRRDRLKRHVLGLFIAQAPRAHGHYSRITGTCTLDLARFTLESPDETAGLLVRCATEAWLWRSGLGRTEEGERRLLILSDRARRQFLRRLAHSGLPVA
jgi:hypothetical protein